MFIWFKRKSCPLLISIYIILTGCAAHHETVRDHPINNSNVIYNSTDSIAVMIANDGVHYYDYNTDSDTTRPTVSKVFVGSGFTLSSKIRSILLTIFDSVKFIETLKLDVALKDASDKTAKYLVAPKIIHWEEQDTPWTGAPDRIEEISVYDVDRKAVIDKLTYKANNESWVLTNYPPENLLNESFQKEIVTFFSP